MFLIRTNENRTWINHGKLVSGFQNTIIDTKQELYRIAYSITKNVKNKKFTITKEKMYTYNLLQLQQLLALKL